MVKPVVIAKLMSENDDNNSAERKEMKGGVNEMLAKQDEHIELTKRGFEDMRGEMRVGFESVVTELKGFRELHE